MRNRIKSLRKTLKLSQAKFGEKLGVSRDAINDIENGRAEIKPLMINHVCLVFGISENWLRTGEGPMYVESENSTLTQVTNLLNLDDTEQKFLAAYLNLPPEIKKTLKEACRQIADFYGAQNETTATSMENAEIEKELVAYRAELEAESRGKTSPLSENTEKERNLA